MRTLKYSSIQKKNTERQAAVGGAKGKSMPSKQFAAQAAVAGPTAQAKFAGNAPVQMAFDEAIVHSQTELMYNEAGAAVKKRTDVHKMAEANKAFSHFRF